MIRCSVCNKLAPKKNQEPCPYASDLHGDDTPQYFWCQNPACKAEVDRHMQDAADDL